MLEVMWFVSPESTNEEESSRVSGEAKYASGVLENCEYGRELGLDEDISLEPQEAK